MADETASVDGGRGGDRGRDSKGKERAIDTLEPLSPIRAYGPCRKYQSPSPEHIQENDTSYWHLECLGVWPMESAELDTEDTRHESFHPSAVGNMLRIDIRAFEYRGRNGTSNDAGAGPSGSGGVRGSGRLVRESGYAISQEHAGRYDRSQSSLHKPRVIYSKKP